MPLTRLESPFRRPLAAATALAAIAAGLTVQAALAPAAHADGSGTLTVVGTSDVYDSELVQKVITPGFEAAYPDITLNYVSKGTGAAITYAEGGSASALIVHAESQENTFVQDGYSLEPAGRAVFYGDYILAGHSADPAGVDPTAPTPSTDIQKAFEQIATSGASGATGATFVSRGDTSGTVTQEHAIWAEIETQIRAGTLTVPGLTLCADSGAAGGYRPATAAGSCTDSSNNPVPYPAWYVATGDTQGPNVEAADACNSAGINGRPTSSCYVFTDRGTFEYLKTTSPAGDPSLSIDVQDATSPDLLNTFHAYAVNPAAVPPAAQSTINTTAATEFLNYLTSPAAQQAIGGYLAAQPGGAPFLPDAHPVLTTTALPTKVTAGKPVTVTGTLANAVPGTPALSGVKVTLTASYSAEAYHPTVSTTTDSTGKFTLSYTPVGQASYTISTPAITKLERTDLNPTFSDILAAGSKTLGTVNVQGTISTKSLKGGKGVVTGSVVLAPQDSFQDGSLQLYYGPYTKGAPKLRYVASINVARGASSVKFTYYLPAGHWFTQLHYVNSGVIVSGTNATISVMVS